LEIEAGAGEERFIVSNANGATDPGKDGIGTRKCCRLAVWELWGASVNVTSGIRSYRA
jgi:hypothetical protein